MDKIGLRQMEFYGYHGVFPEENKLGQRFVVDVELVLDLREAGRTDDLSATISYPDVCKLIQSIVEKRRFRLIEALAECIATSVLETYTIVNEIAVRVVKPHPPVDVHFEGVYVDIRRKRES